MKIFWLFDLFVGCSFVEQHDLLAKLISINERGFQGEKTPGFRKEIVDCLYKTLKYLNIRYSLIKKEKTSHFLIW